MAVVQPPIPEPPGHKEALKKVLEGEKVDPYDIDPDKALAVLAGTDKWREFEISANSPRARGCWVQVHEPEGEAGEEGEGKTYFPRELGPWRVGGWMEDVEWSIGGVTEWTVEKAGT